MAVAVDHSEFDWDEANIQHIARHGVDPAEAEQALDSDPVDLGVEFINGEDRLLSIGTTNRGRILVVATTMRRSRVRVVTAFDAPKQLKLLYLKKRGYADG